MIYIGKDTRNILMYIMFGKRIHWESFKIYNKNNSMEKWEKDISSSLMCKLTWQKKKKQSLSLLRV